MKRTCTCRLKSIDLQRYLNISFVSHIYMALQAILNSYVQLRSFIVSDDDIYLRGKCKKALTLSDVESSAAEDGTGHQLERL